MKRRSRRTQSTQRNIANTAARIMVEQGIHNHRLAAKKAAQRLGVQDLRRLPEPAEIQKALLEYQNLFFGERHGDELRALREQALRAMQAFEAFRPRLVGPVLDGSATGWSGIQLHLFCDTAEQVAMALMEQRIPWDQGEQMLSYGDGSRRSHPVFRFRAGPTEIELVVFTVQGLRNAPFDPLHQRPMARANRARVAALIRPSAEPAAGVTSEAMITD